MKGQSSYVPPPYIPLSQSDREPETETMPSKENAPLQRQHGNDGGEQWSSGICACFDDPQSCSCLTHFILWGLVNTFCCMLTDGILLGLPGCFVACYACGYRRTLRSKYNLQEAPCGDFVTHFCCHLCAMCQEYREVRERSGDANSPDLNQTEVRAPQIQTMELASENK